MKIITLKISFGENEISLKGDNITIAEEIDYSSKELRTVAQLYYLKEFNDELESLVSIIEEKYLNSAKLKHHASFLSTLYKGLGQHLFENYIPEPIGTALSKLSQDTVLLLDLDPVSSLVPWEQMYIEDSYLCLQSILGRTSLKNISSKNVLSKPAQMLFIADPTGDLKGSKNEANYIIGQLRGSQIRVTRYGSEIHKKHYLELLNSGKYDLIHYSGHSEAGLEPGSSYHLFMDGPLFGHEIKSSAHGKMPKLVFSNSCETASSSVQEDVGNTSLASSYLKAGAAGCIASISPVSDSGAGLFASDFYRYLLFGSTVGNALLQSRRNSFKRWGYTDFIWGYFIYFGDPFLKLV